MLRSGGTSAKRRARQAADGESRDRGAGAVRRSWAGGLLLAGVQQPRREACALLGGAQSSRTARALRRRARATAASAAASAARAHRRERAPWRGAGAMATTGATIGGRRRAGGRWRREAQRLKAERGETTEEQRMAAVTAHDGCGRDPRARAQRHGPVSRARRARTRKHAISAERASSRWSARRAARGEVCPRAHRRQSKGGCRGPAWRQREPAWRQQRVRVHERAHACAADAAVPSWAWGARLGHLPRAARGRAAQMAAVTRARARAQRRRARPSRGTARQPAWTGRPPSPTRHGQCRQRRAARAAAARPPTRPTRVRRPPSHGHGVSMAARRYAMPRIVEHELWSGGSGAQAGAPRAAAATALRSRAQPPPPRSAPSSARRRGERRWRGKKGRNIPNSAAREAPASALSRGRRRRCGPRARGRAGLQRQPACRPPATALARTRGWVHGQAIIQKRRERIMQRRVCERNAAAQRQRRHRRAGVCAQQLPPPAEAAWMGVREDERSVQDVRGRVAVV